MKIGYPSILCALECATKETVLAVLPEYDLTFASNEFDLVELAREGRFDLILTSSLKADHRYPRACSIIRMFDPRTPLLFITDLSGPTEEEVLSFDAHIILYESDIATQEIVRQRVREVLGG
jgi:PleD family two-component response regulator